MNTMNKAQQVEQAYDVAWVHNSSSDDCYSLAVAAAHQLGGIETYNSNDGKSRGISFAPTRTFEFDDSSSVYIMYSGVCVMDSPINRNETTKGNHHESQRN